MDLTSPDMNGDMVINGVCVTKAGLLSPGTYSRTWVFPSVRVALIVTFILGFVLLWTNYFRLPDGGRSFTSL